MFIKYCFSIANYEIVHGEEKAKNYAANNVKKSGTYKGQPMTTSEHISVATVGAAGLVHNNGVPIKETGTATAGINVARHVPKDR